MEVQLKSGREWLQQLKDALVPVTKFMALNRYGAAPDADDRVSDALAALVEGSNRFKPQPSKDGLGYFLQYVLSYVAGVLRNGAQLAKDWSEEAVCLTDLVPDWADQGDVLERLGVTRLWEGPVTEEAEGALYVLNNGKVASALEIIGLIMEREERREVAARVLGVQADDADLPVRILQALDAMIIDDADPRWLYGPDGPTPVVTGDLEAVTVTVVQGGVQFAHELSAADFAEAVERASASAAPWTSEDMDAVHYETDDPWPSWVAADGTRSYRSAYMDDNLWPDVVTRELYGEVLSAWREVGYAADVFDALAGTSTGAPDEAQDAIEMMERLAEVLAEESDGSIRGVARALARRVARMHLEIQVEDGQSREDALAEALCWSLGVDGTYGWHEELPSAESLRRPVENWVARVNSQRGIWPSQKAAIGALVLHGASPVEARNAARAAFASR
jgi:hypothetical protein